MKNVFKNHVNFLIMIVMALAMAIFSCSSDSDDAPPSPVLGSSSSTVSSSSGKIVAGFSSSSLVRSSSSVALSSSGGICDPASVEKGTFSDTRNDQAYNTVKICSQTWMAENLNYNDGTNSKCYKDQESNCDTYGRLYDWATAMALPANCNEEICASQITEKHRGVCPPGWHLPSYAEWEALVTAVGGKYTAGKKLKAADGWNSSGNDDDSYGFTALPGGYGDSDGDFYGVGYTGSWWSSSEGDSNDAYIRHMYYGNGDADGYYSGKSYLYSVRCLQD